jgi:hypothetical protein
VWARLVELFNSDLEPSSNRAYATGARAFERFLAEFGIPFSCTPSPSVLAGFIAWLTMPGPRSPAGLAASSINTYLCGVRDMIQRLGAPDPFRGIWSLERVFRAAKKRQSRPVRRRTALVQPVMVLIMEVLFKALAGDPFRRAVVAFAWCLSYNLLLRHGEACPRESAPPEAFPRDSWWCRVNPDVATFSLPRSKTDVFREGVTLTCTRVAGSPLCPIFWHDEMVRLCPFDRRASDGFLLSTGLGVPLSRDKSMALLQACGRELNEVYGFGLDVEAFGNASFRRGGASWLSHLGVPAATIRALGRWKSDAYLLYIDTPMAVRHLAHVALGSVTQRPERSARDWLRGAHSVWEEPDGG